MSDKTIQHGKPTKQPFDKNHPFHPDYAGDSPRSMAPVREDDGVHNKPFAADQRHDEDRRAEQQLKQQQQEQNDRNAFPKGNAQEHQQGNKQK